MADIITTIFRKYDIRGTVAGDHPQLTPDVAHLVGKALGTYLPRTFGTERVFVGMDNRLTSPPLHSALIEGLLSTGMNVTDIGPVLTPTTYFASASYPGVGAGVMITGSHLSTLYNGIKMAYGPLALADQQIQALLTLIQNDDFAVGQGELSRDYDMIHKHMAAIKAKVTIARPLKVVLDAGNGLSGTYIPPLLAELGIEVDCLYCESDGTYPNHLPNPEDPDMTKDLEARVVAIGADLGLAFDGDADRCGFIDDHGHHIAADRLLAVLARDLLARRPGATIVFYVKYEVRGVSVCLNPYGPNCILAILQTLLGRFYSMINCVSYYVDNRVDYLFKYLSVYCCVPALYNKIHFLARILCHISNHP
jgi:phosphomannomutase